MKKSDYLKLIFNIEVHQDEVATWLRHMESGLEEDLRTVAELKALKELTDSALVTRTLADLEKAEAAYQSCDFFKPREPVF